MKFIRDFFIHLRDEAKSLGIEALGEPEEVVDWEPYQDAAHSAHAVGMLIASAMNQVKKTTRKELAGEIVHKLSFECDDIWKILNEIQEE